MYQPNKSLLENYAKILVNFAPHSGRGVKRGEVVQCIIPDTAKLLYGPLQKAILKANAHPLMRFIATGYDKQFYQLANNSQLTFFPKEYIKSRINLVNHTIVILAKNDPHELKDINPKKIFKATEKQEIIRNWQTKKELSGKYTWVIGLYGTPAMASEAGLSIKEYWNQITKACFLNHKNPISKWKSVFKEQNRIKKTLNNLPINKLHITGKNIDLWITLGINRQWLGGSGRNIPSFEIFTSPDWRGTKGKITFNQPLYRYSNKVEGISLEFNKGIITKASATKNNKLLQQLISQKNANKIGEFSLTDSRLSPITKFMAETLYDENIGGKYGNTHIALGSSYKDVYNKNPQKLKKSDWEKLGFNNSSIHSDIVSTQNRTVTAHLKNSTKKIIYKNGRFVI